MRSAFRWAISPWDKAAWESYEPAPDALIPAAVRVGRLVLPDDPGLGGLPGVAPLIREGHMFLRGGESHAARQYRPTLRLRLVAPALPGTLPSVPAGPGG